MNDRDFRLVATWVSGFIILAAAPLFVSAAFAKDSGQYTNAKNKAWFAAQYNAKGQWCCDVSDGHLFYGDYKLSDNGDVEFDADGKHYHLPAYMVLSRPNPNGAAVWWYAEGLSGERSSYCFAPGSAG